MKNSFMAEAFQEKWLSYIFFLFFWVMSRNHLKSLCFKGHLALSFRNTFTTIRILVE